MIEIFTDGSCRGNPGPGGFGLAMFRGNSLLLSVSHTSESTTNNRMELSAILLALAYINSKEIEEEFIIYSDSAYCVNMINNWIYKWSKNGWITSKKMPVENLDLVKKIYKELLILKNTKVEKVKGHNGECKNEYVDALASQNKSKAEKMLKYFNLQNYDPMINALDK